MPTPRKEMPAAAKVLLRWRLPKTYLGIVLGTDRGLIGRWARTVGAEPYRQGVDPAALPAEVLQDVLDGTYTERDPLPEAAKPVRPKTLPPSGNEDGKPERPERPEPTLEERVVTLRERQLDVFAHREQQRQVEHEAFKQALCDLLEESIPSLGAADVFPPAPEAATEPHRPEEANAVWSDHHIGETVNPVHTGGLGGFNWNIYQARMLTWERAARRIIQMHQMVRPIRHLNIYSLGDMATGQLVYEGQTGFIDKHIGQQIVEGAAFLAPMVRRFLDLVETVDLYAVPGNHGRTGPKKMALPPAANFDWILMEMLRLWLRDEPRVHLDNSEAMYLIVERPGADFLLMHGDNIRAWNTIPWYGAERHTRRMRELLGVRARYVLIGHQHVPAAWSQADGEICFNGSVLGPTDFSVNKLGVGSLPSQRLFFTHPHYGKTADYDLRLATWEEIRKVDVRGHHQHERATA